MIAIGNAISYTNDKAWTGFKACFSGFEFILKHLFAVKKGILVVLLVAADLLAKGDFAKFVHDLSICWVNIRCRLFIVSNLQDLHLGNTFEI